LAGPSVRLSDPMRAVIGTYLLLALLAVVIIAWAESR
jgi:hypothetical protein